MANQNIKFTNGVEMNQQHPDTYHIPSEAEKVAVKPGDNVKVGVAVAGRVNSEKFWVLVTENDTANQIITGTVNNDLVCTDSHGLVDGDSITVPYYAILDTI